MVNDIIEEIKKGLTGNAPADGAYLQQQAMKYRSHENATEILHIISDMTFDLMPEDKKEYLKKAMFIGDKRLDQAFNEANKLFKDRKLEEAAKLMEKIEYQADTYFNGNEQVGQFCFRNRFEEYLYSHLYKPENKYENTPFDFCTYLNSYGYILVELGKPEDAERVLLKSIKYNPINSAPRFELAETYKLMKNPEKLLSCVKETLGIASSPEDIARCYCDLGYYCIDVKDYDSAVCFYYESLLYAPNDNVTGELHHIAAMTGKEITPPSRDDIMAAFEKYQVKNGPDQDVINIAYSLGEYCVEHNAAPQETLFYYSIAYRLTREEKLKKKMDEIAAKIEKK